MIRAILAPMEKISYNTRLDRELIKKFKILAIELGLRQNELLEESMKDTLKKHESKTSPKKGKPQP
jgi:hypothetical protein